ncbi:MAG: bifunctional 4-hydroxy-2-oxoglutarate aldolase/2-dehydro-3-deoxy-phosphogluconate aldolase [Aeromonadaceae bacterium]|nr:bifunctional 4-hydroxy-2-oxoglutarate aldolase/2-dehydro-3-deoxy-phosphogluconate aldolase [Aeromonas sp.]MBP8220141.1 bifunctional 4-hydroxy-2-oxoglutarate aldolase/2-dehydro-3-deoxy-phosphogluconate aldolase [Aeromonadaceae bacterium]
MPFTDRLHQLRLLPVIALSRAEQAVSLGQTLLAAGLPAAEITFRTPAAAEAIRRLRAAFPELLIAAGTILTPAQVDTALAAGADLIVSPGLNPNTVRYCQQQGIPIIPGVNNPSQVEQALELGLSTLKFFPAEASGGLAMLKALAAVYPVQFMPTGGISPANVQQYLALPNVIACGGSWMVPGDLIDQGDWAALGRLIAEAVALLHQP